MEQSKKNTLVYARWWVIRLSMALFDIFAVNFAYFCALVLRFYVANEFNVWAVKYIPAYVQFAPYYTVCCLVVFFLFKLYNSRWKYAGLNDLNRILAACAVTFVIQIIGTMLFVMRMPLTYYAIGAAIQFLLITVSRFAYRFFIEGRDQIRKSRNKTAINVMVVGSGETSRIVLQHLNRNVDNAAKPVCLLDYRNNEFGSMLEGLPVVSGLDKLASAVQKYGVESVILADTIMPQDTRKQIREICAGVGVEVQDFSSCFEDFRGAVSLRNLMEYTKGPVELVVGSRCESFDNGEEAMLSLNGKYVVSAVWAKDSKLVVELQKDILVPNDVKEEWVQSYKEETGEDISFF